MCKVNLIAEVNRKSIKVMFFILILKCKMLWLHMSIIIYWPSRRLSIMSMRRGWGRKEGCGEGIKELPDKVPLNQTLIMYCALLLWSPLYQKSLQYSTSPPPPSPHHFFEGGLAKPLYGEMYITRNVNSLI